MQTPTEPVTLAVDDDGSDQRLDKWVAARIPGWTRAKIQRLIDQGAITVNRRQAKIGGKLKRGDVIHITLPEPQPTALIPKKLDLDILYEDEAIIVVNKPAGLVVHPGAGETGTTLAEGLLYHFGYRDGDDDQRGGLRPGIVHRLDKDTTGVMICAKNDEAVAHLAAQFAAKTNDREYVALLNGVLKPPQVIRESYLFRDPNSRLRFQSMSLNEYAERFGGGGDGPKSYRYAKTLFQCQETFASRLCLAAVKLFTGRTHQIRIHARDLGMHILGDPVYGQTVRLPQYFSPQVRDAVGSLDRQMLHARLLGIVHPVTGLKMTFEVGIPSDFRMLIELLEPYRHLD